MKALSHMPSNLGYKSRNYRRKHIGLKSKTSTYIFNDAKKSHSEISKDLQRPILQFHMNLCQTYEQSTLQTFLSNTILSAFPWALHGSRTELVLPCGAMRVTSDLLLSEKINNSFSLKRMMKKSLGFVFKLCKLAQTSRRAECRQEERSIITLITVLLLIYILPCYLHLCHLMKILSVSERAATFQSFPGRSYLSLYTSNTVKYLWYASDCRKQNKSSSRYLNQNANKRFQCE